MIQAVMRNGKFRRFVGKVPKEFLGEIRLSKQLTKEEEGMIPEMQNGNLVMRYPTGDDLVTRKKKAHKESVSTVVDTLSEAITQAYLDDTDLKDEFDKIREVLKKEK
jgi:hypothetical protein